LPWTKRKRKTRKTSSLSYSEAIGGKEQEKLRIDERQVHLLLTRLLLSSTRRRYKKILRMRIVDRAHLRAVNDRTLHLLILNKNVSVDHLLTIIVYLRRICPLQAAMLVPSAKRLVPHQRFASSRVVEHWIRNNELSRKD